MKKYSMMLALAALTIPVATLTLKMRDAAEAVAAPP